jgi:AcrR family transcriptional regulator
MTEVVRPYRGVSADDRRADRRSRLLEACLDLIGEDGVAEVTAEGTAARAGLSKRYFYESFADRDALLVAASDEVFAAVRSAILQRLVEYGDASVEERIRATVATLVKAMTADSRSARLYVEASRHPVLEARRLGMFDQFATLLDEQLFASDPHDQRLHTVSLLLVAGTTEVLARWLAGDIALDEEALVATISDVGLAAARSLGS